mgnify:FL=1
MKKILFYTSFLFLIFQSYADCGSQETAYSSIKTYLSTCKNDPIDCSHGDPRCGFCPTLMLTMVQAVQTLALSPANPSDKMCIVDPTVQTTSILQYKAKLDLNNQYGWQNPCSYNYPISQITGVSTFSEYMGVLFDNFCF